MFFAVFLGTIVYGYGKVNNMHANNRPRRGSKLAAQPQRGFWDKFWHDKHGKLVVFQPPNPFLISWVVTFVLSQLIRSEPWQSIFSWTAFAALILWALNEAIFGVNYFRRYLGVTIFLLSILVRF